MSPTNDAVIQRLQWARDQLQNVVEKAKKADEHVQQAMQDLAEQGDGNGTGGEDPAVFYADGFTGEGPLEDHTSDSGHSYITDEQDSDDACELLAGRLVCRDATLGTWARVDNVESDEATFEVDFTLDHFADVAENRVGIAVLEDGDWTRSLWAYYNGAHAAWYCTTWSTTLHTRPVQLAPGTYQLRARVSPGRIRLYQLDEGGGETLLVDSHGRSAADKPSAPRQVGVFMRGVMTADSGTHLAQVEARAVQSSGPGEQQVSTVIVSPASSTLDVGQTRQLTATPLDLTGVEVLDVTIEWSSETPDIAGVDGDGTVTGLAPGDGRIAAEAAGVTGRATVTVREPNDGGDPGDTDPPITDGLLFHEDFEGHAVGQNLAQKQGPGTLRYLTSHPTIVVSDEHAHSGTRSLKITYPGEPDPAEMSSRETRFVFWPREDVANAPDELWGEWWIRVPDNYVHRESEGGHNNKLLLLCNAVDGPGDKSFKDSVRRPLVLWEYQYGDEEHSFVRAGSWGGDTDINPYGTSSDQFQEIKGNIFTAERRGQWIRVRWHVRISLTAGVLDMWVGNQKVCQMPADICTAFTEGSRTRSGELIPVMPQTLNAGYLFGWSNSGFAEDTSFYVDDWRMWRERPDWADELGA